MTVECTSDKKPSPSHFDDVAFHFVDRLPDLKETDCGVEPVEDSQWHADVCDDSPSPESEEPHVRWPKSGLVFGQRTYNPHGHIADQEKRDDLSTRLLTVLVGTFAPSPP